MNNKRIGKTQRIAGLALFTAIVIVLQLLGSFIRFGPFSISLVLVPIVIGAALYGAEAGAWLGLVFGVVVTALDAAPFLAFNPVGTVITCVMKGVLAGLCAGLTYRLLSGVNEIAAVVAAALVCPVVNTGVFLIGCRIFFFPLMTEWSVSAGFPNAGRYMIFGLVGANFLFETAINMILSPTVVRLVRTARGSITASRNHQRQEAAK